MKQVIRIVFSFSLAFVSLSSFGQEPDDSPTRLDFLLERADLMKIEIVGEGGKVAAATRVKEPALRYQNPLYEEQSDGVLLIWAADSIPVAFASYSIRFDKDVFREFATSCDLPMRCTMDGNLVWAPKPQFTRRKFGADMPVPENTRLRLRTMKRLAEKFESGNKRVLPTPVYRYENTGEGVIDGAVFALSDTNDPEMLVLVEAIRGKDDKPSTWQYTLTRMNSQPQQVHLDGQLVWDLKGYWRNPKSIQDPYVEVRDDALPEELKLSSGDR